MIDVKVFCILFAIKLQLLYRIVLCSIVLYSSNGEKTHSNTQKDLVSFRLAELQNCKSSTFVLYINCCFYNSLLSFVVLDNSTDVLLQEMLKRGILHPSLIVSLHSFVLKNVEKVQREMIF